jgi:hypothetical protein
MIGLRRAALLAAIGSVLGLTFSLLENADAFIRTALGNLSNPNHSFFSQFPIEIARTIGGMSFMLLLSLPAAAFSLMLVVIYRELAGRTQWLSVKQTATWAAVGYGLVTALGIYQPFALFAGRILFRTNLQTANWVVVLCLRLGWMVLCAMIALRGLQTRDQRLGRVALALIALEAFTGIRGTWFQVQSFHTALIRELRRGWIPMAIARDAVALFGWLTLCVFLFELWRSSLALSEPLASTGDLPHPTR